MGNKQSRDLTRSKERGTPCTCDVFDITVACDGNSLFVSLLTDLPANIKVTIKARRLFRASDGGSLYWNSLDEDVPVTPQDSGLNGFVFRRTIDELDTKGLNMARQLMRGRNAEIVGPPSTNLDITVSAPTTTHRFGLCNRRLTGKAVTIRPSGHSLDRSATIDVPRSEWVMKQLGF